MASFPPQEVNLKEWSQAEKTYRNLNFDLCWLFSPFSLVFGPPKMSNWEFIKKIAGNSQKVDENATILNILIFRRRDQITLAQFWFFRSFSCSSHFRNVKTTTDDVESKTRQFLQKFYLHPTHLFKSEQRTDFPWKRWKRRNSYSRKKSTLFYKVSQFFSIRAINRVQSQALKSGIECEKKGIMNKWDAEKKCRQLVSIISKMTVKGWEKKTKRVITIVSKESKYWHKSF